MLVGGVGEFVAVASARQFMADLDLAEPRVARRDAGPGELVDVGTQLSYQRSPLGDAHRTPTIGQHRERIRIRVGRHGHVIHGAHATADLSPRAARRSRARSSLGAMPATESVGDLLRDTSDELARQFEDVALPAPFVYARRHQSSGRADSQPEHPDRTSPIPWPHGSVPTVVLAGPGVLAQPGGRAGLAEFARRANVGVANTWGSKGVFRWDSPHHLGTCGLQANDFELLGFADYELIVATGIDPAESPEASFGLAPVTHIAPTDLGRMTEVGRLMDQIPTNDLYTRLAALAGPGYVNESFPRHPARAVMDLKQSLTPTTIVFGDPGPVGLWLARTFPTDRPGSICVPAVARPGIAAALALAAAGAGIDAVAVTTAPIDDITHSILEVAPVGFRLESWGDDVDWSATGELIDAAGPIVAWKEEEHRA